MPVHWGDRKAIAREHGAITGEHALVITGEHAAITPEIAACSGVHVLSSDRANEKFACVGLRACVVWLNMSERERVPELLTVDEVAALLRTTPAGVRQRVARGGIPGVVPKLRPMRFKRAVIREWLDLPTGQD